MADTYTVVTQVPTTDIGPAGQVVRATEVTFTTKPSNVTGKVVIFARNPTAEEAAPIIEAAARNIEAVQAL